MENIIRKSLNEQLYGACQRGDLKDVVKLVDSGADPRFLNDGAVCLAALNGNLEIVEYLVSLGCDVMCHDGLALKWASEHKHFKVLKFLEGAKNG